MTTLILGVVLIIAFGWHKKIVEEKDIELNTLAKQHAFGMTMHSRDDLDETIEYLKDEYIDRMDLSKKEKKRTKKLSKLKLKYISEYLKDGAYSRENVAKGKYMLPSTEAVNKVNEFAALQQLISQAAIISWTIADAASVDAVNENAVNIVNYQLESLISTYLEAFESKYQQEQIINCVKDGLNFEQVTQSMRENSYILFPDKYQTTLFIIEEEEETKKDVAADEAKVRKIWDEVGGEKKYMEMVNWAIENLGQEYIQDLAKNNKKAIQENNYERLRELTLALEKTYKLNRNKSNS